MILQFWQFLHISKIFHGEKKKSFTGIKGKPAIKKQTIWTNNSVLYAFGVCRLLCFSNQTLEISL